MKRYDKCGCRKFFWIEDEDDREDEYIECLASIMNDISELQFSDVIFGGDLNMELNNKSNLCKQLCSFASDLQLRFVDDKISSIDKCTFRVEATGSFSTIDHFAVSENLYNHVHDVKVYDSGINLSDHCPLILMVDVLLSLAPNVSCSSNTRSSSKSGDVLSFRWDKVTSTSIVC